MDPIDEAQLLDGCTFVLMHPKCIHDFSALKTDLNTANDDDQCNATVDGRLVGLNFGAFEDDFVDFAWKQKEQT